MHRTAYQNDLGPPNPGTILVAERPRVNVDWPRSDRDNALVERRISGRRVRPRSNDGWRRPQRGDLVALAIGASLLLTAAFAGWYFL